jgi:hypothetical protein
VLLNLIRDAFPSGIPLDDARQVFYWLYISSSVLPKSLQGNPPDRQELVEVFSALAAEGRIRSESSGAEPGCTSDRGYWSAQLDELLKDPTRVKDSYRERAKSWLESGVE